MRHLFRQWRFVRFLDKRTREMRDSSVAEGFLLGSQGVLATYAHLREITAAEASDLLRSCVSNGYVDEGVVQVTHGKGRAATMLIYVASVLGRTNRAIAFGIVNAVKANPDSEEITITTHDGLLSITVRQHAQVAVTV